MANISIWEKIADIPWWAYLIVSYIIYTQYLALKPRTVPIRKTMLSFLLLAFFATLLLTWQLTTHANLIAAQMIAYLISIILSGITFGFLQCKFARISVLINTKQIHLSGSVINFLIGITSFILLWQANQHYGLTWLMSPTVLLLWCGLFTGLIIGRLIALSLAIKKAQMIIA